ncbi:MAG: ribonuclease E, partial [Paraglaciecola sp.]
VAAPVVAPVAAPVTAPVAAPATAPVTTPAVAVTTSAAMTPGSETKKVAQTAKPGSVSHPMAKPASIEHAFTQVKVGSLANEARPAIKLSAKTATFAKSSASAAATRPGSDV